MKIVIRGLFGALIFVACVISSMAQTIPLNEPEFTDYIAARVRSQLPDVPVTIKESLTLSIGELQANLHRIFGFCKTNRQACSLEVDRFVGGAVQVVQDGRTPPSRENVRVVVRSTQYITNAQKSMPSGALAMQPRPLMEGLVLVPVLDFPRVTRMLSESDNQTLALSADEIFQLGLANVEKQQKPIMEIAKPAGRGQIGHISGNSYHSSRLAMPASWLPLMQAQGGILIVAAPATDVVLYIGENTAIAIDALRALVNKVGRSVPNPLSSTLLQLTPGGWQVVP